MLRKFSSVRLLKYTISSTRVYKLRPQELAQCLERTLTPHVIHRAAKAHRAALSVGACIRGHDDDGVFKVYGPALSVGYPAVVKDLEQNIQNVGMRLFYLVKQHDRIRLAADLLGELACLVIADIARRRTDNARYAEFFP